MYPLQGVRVVEMAVWQQGPGCGVMLADLGAEVIKVEEPTSGDPGRYINFRLAGAANPDVGAYFEALNRGKRSVALNVANAEGRRALLRLVERSDVFLSNLRQAKLQKLGLDYEALRATNPRLVYALGTGSGLVGPDAARPSFDIAAQARGGLLSISGEGAPVPIGAGLADQVGATYLALGILSALLMRERTGQGQLVESSLLAGQAALGHYVLQSYFFHRVPIKKRPRTEIINPLWNVYQAKDVRWIMLGMTQSDHYWHDFCAAMGLEVIEDLPRFKDHLAREGSAPELITTLDQRFATATVAEWEERFRRYDLVWDVVRSYEEVAADPQLWAAGVFARMPHPTAGETAYVRFPASFSGASAKPTRWAPELGQHTEEVLIEVGGYTWGDVESLRAAGAIP